MKVWCSVNKDKYENKQNEKERKMKKMIVIRKTKVMN